MGAIAARTNRVRLGTAVLLGALRHPVLLAQAVGTLDLISKGRAVLALGVGGAYNDEQRKEWASVGVQPNQRAGRLEELVEILSNLTKGNVVNYEGKHFQIKSVTVQPNAANRGGVPILLACHLKAGRDVQFERVARFGEGFISISETPDDFSKVAKKVKMQAQKAGRDFDSMEAVFYMTININQNERIAKEEADRFLKKYYGINIWNDIWGPFGPPEQIVRSILSYASSGAKTIVVRFASFDQRGQLDTFLRKIVPELGG